MKAVIVTACLSLLATLSTFWNAQASPTQQRFAKSSFPSATNPQPTQKATPIPSPDPRPEIVPIPQSSQPQPSPGDPRRNPQEPCPACGMG